MKGVRDRKSVLLMYNYLTFERENMESNLIAHRLEGLPLGGVRIFDSIDSTNSEAARWIDQGAPDMGLVLADEQTQGKGRLGRDWFTPPGAALAFSLVLHHMDDGYGYEVSKEFQAINLMRITGLGAVAICEALETEFDLFARIKWPNDVLLLGRKTAGILVETSWQGGRALASILGIGINVDAGSVPLDERVNFPATCVENALDKPVDRYELLRSVLESIVRWRPQLSDPAFIQAWDERLAYKNDWVGIFDDTGSVQVATRQGKLIGLDNHGRLKLQDEPGSEFFLISGELSLRAASI